MKTTLRLMVFASIVLVSYPAPAGNVYEIGIVGYYNYSFAAGNTLFTSQLDQSPNNLSTLFHYSTPADGTTLSLWNPATQTFNAASTYASGAWSVDLTLQAGIGYLLNTSTAFINTFVGNVRNHDGTFLSAIDLTPPPVYAGANGLYLLGDKTIMPATGTDIFLNILGRLPNVGEQVITLASTSTFLGDAGWDGGVPRLKVGDAAFLNIGPVAVVPEPSTVILGFTCFGLLQVWRRRQ